MRERAFGRRRSACPSVCEVFDAKTVDGALALEAVDTLGLDDLDRKYLRTIRDIYEGGPVGLDAIAATMGDDSDTLEDVVEPYLLRIGFVARTRQGRKLTVQAGEYLAAR